MAVKGYFASSFTSPGISRGLVISKFLPAQFDKQQAVHGQGENVIQRQRGHHELFAAMQQRAVGGIDLLEVSQHIAVG